MVPATRPGGPGHRRARWVVVIGMHAFDLHQAWRWLVGRDEVCGCDGSCKALAEEAPIDHPSQTAETEENQSTACVIFLSFIVHRVGFWGHSCLILRPAPWSGCSTRFPPGAGSCRPMHKFRMEWEVLKEGEVFR